MDIEVKSFDEHVHRLVERAFNPEFVSKYPFLESEGELLVLSVSFLTFHGSWNKLTYPFMH